MTRNKVEPTPTPWKAAISGTRMTLVNANRFILDFEGRDGTQEDIEADAAFIVRAVNCHEAFLKASKHIVLALETRFARTGCNAAEEIAMKELRDAIAKAEGH